MGADVVTTAFGAAIIHYTHRDGHPRDVTAYGLAGTPNTCAQVGLSGVFGSGPFDLLVGGINLGADFGFEVFCSGTVGAALTAHLLGIPANAVAFGYLSVTPFKDFPDLLAWEPVNPPLGITEPSLLSTREVAEA